ncbi:MAG: ribonuclease H-like domain-containing protein [Candidatus Limnocylindrales bacterium]
MAEQQARPIPLHPEDPAGSTGPADLAHRLARFRAHHAGASPLVGADRLPATRPDPAMRLAAALDGAVERSPLGRVVRIRTTTVLPAPLERLATLPYPVDPGRPLVCLDTETTGLGTAAGTVVFLVGLGRWDGERFVVEQLLLPDHSDEPAFLAALESAIPPDAWLVTYNGLGFDWPLLVTRFRLHGAMAPAHAGHLDLLPVARQLWRHRLPDARLATVERGVVRVQRNGDLPGALVPARYLDFLRTGRAAPLRAVLDHNRQDVLSLGLLLAHLARHLSDLQAYAAEEPGDVAALGHAYARHGRYEEALACCTAAVAASREPRLRARLAEERARLLRRCGRYGESAAAWQEIARAGGPSAAVAWVQLAKHLEHVTRDPIAALAAVEQAAQLLERSRLLGSGLPRLERDLPRRRDRLLRRARSTRSRRSAVRLLPPAVPDRGSTGHAG